MHVEPWLLWRLQIEKLKAAHEREVDSIQAELDEVSRTLASTQDQLTEAQIAIQERQFLILSHQRAEHALAAYAQQLTGELAGAARDLELLFGKFGEVLDMQKGDRCEPLAAGATMGELYFMCNRIMHQQQNIHSRVHLLLPLIVACSCTEALFVELCV